MNKGELVILFPRVHDSYDKWVNCEVTKEAVPACFLLSASGARCITLCRESSSSSDSEALRTLLFYKSHSFWRTCTSFIYTIIHKWMKKRWLCLLCHFIRPTWTETKSLMLFKKLCLINVRTAVITPTLRLWLLRAPTHVPVNHPDSDSSSIIQSVIHL